MGEIPSTPPPVPPSCADCVTKIESEGAKPVQTASRMWRSADGKTRIDTPQTSMIADPAAQKMIVLDHLKKEAKIFPMKAAADAAPVASQAQAAAAAAQASAMQVEDLGKSMIEGHEVEGKRFKLPPLPEAAKPKMPEMPKLPALPKVPGMPAALTMPKLPEAPKLPPKPTVTEVWSSVKLKFPVLTKVKTDVGEQTTYCKPKSEEEPHPSVFQIPAGYKLKPNS